MARFIIGEKPKHPRKYKLYVIELTTRYKDGTDVENMSTYYARTKSEKARADAKAAAINAKYHPDTYKPKYPNRFTTILARSAKVKLVDFVDDGIPVYLSN